MKHKERMLAALGGQPTDLIPWAPRLDLWYNANRQAGSLPPKYGQATLREITDDLDFGLHAIVPNFKDLRQPLDDAHRALGIYNLWTMPYATLLENVGVTVTPHGDETAVEYRTPHGTITTRVLYDDTMRRAGVSISHIAEPAIKSSRDFAAIRYIFENARVVPNEAGYREFAAGVGERGIAAGFISLAASPMHLLLRELMPLPLFFYELYDHPDELAACAVGIGMYFERVFEVAARCSADVIFLGANYDASITSPPFFKEHIGPWLRRFAERIHPKKKFLLTHTDGENTGLLDHYLASGIDIADSICPAPMTQLSFKQVRDRLAGKITIMGGIPSVCLLKSSMADRDFEAYLDRFFSELGRGDHLILGVSDTTPPAATLDRLKAIAGRVRAFGPVGTTHSAARAPTQSAS